MLTEKHGTAQPPGSLKAIANFDFGQNLVLTVTRRLALAFALVAPALHAAEYRIDPAHTYVSFEIDHLGFSTQRGMFNRSSGSVAFDQEARSGKIDIRIEAASLNTGFEPRDEVLRGEDWFNVQSFPDILFRNGSILFEENRPVAVEGTLVLLGTAKPIRLEIKRFKCGLNLATRKRGCGADAQGLLQRSEFGMEQGLPFIGDEVRLRIQVEAYPP